MAWTTQKITDTMMNPYYAINFALQLFVVGPLSKTRDQWMKENAQMINKLGASTWLTYLLQSLKNGVTAGGIVVPNHVIHLQSHLATTHEPIVSESMWIRVNERLIKEMGARKWLSRLLYILENGGLSAEDIERVNPEDLPRHIEDIIKVSQKLIKIPTERSDLSGFQTVTEGCLKKNVLRLKAILKLAKYSDLGGSALQIARNMLEDLAYMEYIDAQSLPARDQLIKQFFEFRWVEFKADLEDYKDAMRREKNAPPLFSKEFENLIEQNYKRVAAQYKDFATRHDGSLPHAWSSHKVEGMIKKMLRQGRLSADKASFMLYAYNEGSRSTHFNPGDTLLHLGFEEEGIRARSLFSLVCGAFSLLYLSRLYIKCNLDDNNKKTKAVAEIERLISINFEILKTATETIWRRT